MPDMKLLICIFALVATAMSESTEELLRSSSEKFTFNFFQEAAKIKSGESFVVSPFSVMSPLAQLGLASVGDSHDEILKTIGLPNDNAVKAVYSDVTKQLRSVKGIDLKLANRIYVREGEALNDAFAVVSKDVFDSDVKNVDFSKNTAAAHAINTWVEEKTNHRIKDLVPADSLDASTNAVLVNAIYFKGKWTKPFEKKQTQDQDFHVTKDKTIKVPTMQKFESLRYGESKELDAKLVELPYEGDQSSLLIVLPNDIDGITDLVDKFKDPSVLSKSVNEMYNTDVQLQMPKFKVETTTDLGVVLKKMDVNKLFSPGQAHLDNLIKNKSDLYVSSGIQKAFIEINEEGAEAAAANDLSLDVRAAFRSTAEFVADHPFVFAVLCKSSETKRLLNAFTGIFVR